MAPYLNCILSLFISTMLCVQLNGRRSQLTAKKYTASFENPPFFPTSIEELAQDVRMRIVNRDRYIFKWLLLVALHLVDEEFTKLRVFISNKEDQTRCVQLLDEAIRDYCYSNPAQSQRFDINRKNPHEIIRVSHISEVNLKTDDKLMIIYNPDNIYQNIPNLLEDVQALCFHGALKKIPVVLINPNLMATAWNDYGVRPPLLLSDFSQVYYACDDYFMVNRKDQWCGIVQRAASGFDLFLLDGFFPGDQSPKTYQRIDSWVEGMPRDIRSRLSRLVMEDPKFSRACDSNRRWSHERAEWGPQHHSSSSSSSMQSGPIGTRVDLAMCKVSNANATATASASTTTTSDATTSANVGSSNRRPVRKASSGKDITTTSIQSESNGRHKSLASDKDEDKNGNGIGNNAHGYRSGESARSIINGDDFLIN